MNTRTLVTTFLFVLATGLPVFSIDFVLQEQHKIDSYSFVANISSYENEMFISIGGDAFLFSNDTLISFPLGNEDPSVVLSADYSEDRLYLLSGYPGGQSELYEYSISRSTKTLVFEKGIRFAAQRVFAPNDGSYLLNGWDSESETSVLVRIDRETGRTDTLLQNDNLTVFCIGESGDTYIYEAAERFANPVTFFYDGSQSHVINKFNLVTNAVFINEVSFLVKTESGIWLVEKGKQGLAYRKLPINLTGILDFEYSDSDRRLFVITREVKQQISMLYVYSVVD